MKRYDLDHDHFSDCYCSMEQSKDGAYVRSEDVIELLETLKILRALCIPGMNWTCPIGKATLKQVDAVLAKLDEQS